MIADGRLRAVQLFGGAGKAQMPGGGLERPKESEVGAGASSADCLRVSEDSIGNTAGVHLVRERHPHGVICDRASGGGATSGATTLDGSRIIPPTHHVPFATQKRRQVTKMAI